jgi:hypothetical protein
MSPHAARDRRPPEDEFIGRGSFQLHVKKSKSVVGFAWYRREEWQRLREMSSDRERLEEDFEEWLRCASRAFEDAKRAGISVMKVDVNVEELLNWCRQSKLAIDASARAGFVAQKVQRMKMD